MSDLPVCQHCHQQWTYKESLKNMLFMKCPYCGNRNYARKFRTRDIVFSLSVSIIVLFVFPIAEVSLRWTILFAMLALGIYLLTYPIKLHMTKDEEPFF